MAVISLRRTIDCLGLMCLMAYIAIAALSYFEAPVIWTSQFAPNASAAFAKLFGQEHLNAIRALFGGPMPAIVTRWVPVILISAAAIALMILVRRNEAGEDDAIATRSLQWAYVFALAAFFAYPVFTQDFWLSALWGDMTISGTNPYHQKFTPEMITGLGLPLDHFPMTMSYGPLWAVLSAAVMSVSGGSVILAGLLFKLILLAGWCATLFLVDRIMHAVSPGNRALALIVAGWVPLGVLETVAEGHNDIAMALFALLWLALLLQKRMSAPVALAVSVLCKYTTAPLFLVDMLHSLRAHRIGFANYVRRMILPGLIGLAITALFYRSFAFFDGVRLVDSWHFMQPSDAFLAITDLLGGWGEPLENLFLLIFPAIAAHQAVTYWKQPDNEQLFRLVLAVMCTVTFSAIGHVWSWYLVWTLPLAALVPRWWLSRFVTGLALVVPFTVLVWWVPEFEDYKNLAALLMYVAAAVWTVLTSEPVAEVEGEEAPAPIRLVDFIGARNKVLLDNASRRLQPDFRAKLRVPTKAASGEN